MRVCVCACMYNKSETNNYYLPVFGTCCDLATGWCMRKSDQVPVMRLLPLHFLSTSL